MSVLVVERLRKRTGRRIAPAIGILAREHARSARAEHDRDPVGAVAVDGCGDSLGETVRMERHVGEPVVATVEAPEIGRKRMGFDTVDPSDIPHRDLPEVAGAQAASPFPHGVQGGGRRLCPWPRRLW